MTASSPRSHSGNEAKYAIDGNTSSIWHTIWSSSEGQMPVISENGRDNYITLDLGENKSVTRLLHICQDRILLRTAILQDIRLCTAQLLTVTIS